MHRFSRAALLGAGSAAALLGLPVAASILGVETTHVALLASALGERAYPSGFVG